MLKYSFKSILFSDFENRKKTSHKTSLIFVIGLFILIGVTSSWVYGAIAAVVVFFIQSSIANKREVYFITKFEVYDDEIHISYDEKGEIKEIIGNKNDFELKKKHTIEKGSTAYLVINYKGSLLLTQYRTKEWTEPLMNEVILASKN